MLLALIICHLSVLVAANPFHKYPFVFLLDVGNEELEKTNSEQIRVSVPGGSLALRYPAIGNGNIISHVRVTGIDFGTDLKANIVDGGPGNTYVVIVLMGNPGVPFDAVLTVCTVANSNFSPQNGGTVVNSDVNTYQSEEDENNGGEDLSDSEESNNSQSETYVQNTNAELMQSSSNVYNYAANEPVEDSDGDYDGLGDQSDCSNSDNEDPGNEEYSNKLSTSSDESEDEDEFESVNGEKDIHVQYADNIDKGNRQNVGVKAIDDDEDVQSDDNDDDEEESNNNEEFDLSYDDPAKPMIVDSNLYTKNEILKDHLNFGGNAYSQEEFHRNAKPVEDPLDYEDPDAEEPVYENEGDKFRDSNNNNYLDSDDSYAVAY